MQSAGAPPTGAATGLTSEAGGVAGIQRMLLFSNLGGFGSRPDQTANGERRENGRSAPKPDAETTTCVYADPHPLTSPGPLLHRHERAEHLLCLGYPQYRPRALTDEAPHSAVLSRNCASETSRAVPTRCCGGKRVCKHLAQDHLHILTQLPGGDRPQQRNISTHSVADSLPLPPFQHLGQRWGEAGLGISGSRAVPFAMMRPCLPKNLRTSRGLTRLT